MKRLIERIDYLEEKDNLEIYLHKRRYELVKRYCREGNILDLGCGLGWGGSFLSPKGYVIGLDIDKEAIREAKRRYASNSNVEFICADATNLPFRDKSLDTVVSIENIEHIKDQEKYIQTVYRVLKKDGILVLSTPNRLDPHMKLEKALGIYQPNPYHTHEFSPKELFLSLSREGFTIISYRGVFLHIPVVTRFLRKYQLFCKLLVNFNSIKLCRYTFVVAKKKRKGNEAPINLG